MSRAAKLLPRPRRGAVAIWLLAALLLATASALGAGASQAGASPATGPQVSSGITPNRLPTQPTPAPAPTAGAEQPRSWGERYNYGNAENLLPAFRWTNTDLTTNFGLSDYKDPIGTSGVNSFAGILFIIASFIWWALVQVGKFALTTDFVDSAANQINLIFVKLTDAIGLGGRPWLVAIIGFAAVIAAARSVLRGKGASAARIVVAALIPLAVIQALAASTGNVVGKDEAVVAQPTSPAGLAKWGNQQLSGITQVMLGGITSIETGALGYAWSAGANELGGANPAPGCAEFSEGLYAAYDYTRNANAGAAGVSVANTQTKQLSVLWELGYLRNYLQAEFGNSGVANKVGCHFLEFTNAGDPLESQYIAIGWGGYGAIDGGPGPGPWAMRNDMQQQTADVFAWAVCDWDGSAWKPRPGWATEETGVSAGSCQLWWRNAGTDSEPRLVKTDATFDAAAELGKNCVAAAGGGSLILGPFGAVVGASWCAYQGDGNADAAFEWRNGGSFRDVTEVAADDTAQVRLGKEQMLASVDSFWGHNVGTRLANGFMAVVTALVYLYAVGALAIGAIIAQFGLVVMLALLPITLALYALPTSDGSRNPAGRKMLRLTVGYFAARLFFSVVLALLLIIMMVGYALVTSLDLGFAQGVIGLAVPLFAIFLLRSLLKRAGLGDLAKISGALGMPTSVARAAASDNFSQGLRSATRTSPFNELGRKPLTDRFDRYNKKAQSFAGGAGTIAGATARGAVRAGRGVVGGVAAVAAGGRYAGKKVLDALGQRSMPPGGQGEAGATRAMAGVLSGVNAETAARSFADKNMAGRLAGGAPSHKMTLDELNAKSGAHAREADSFAAACVRNGVSSDQRRAFAADHYETIGSAAAAAVGVERGRILNRAERGDVAAGVAAAHPGLSGVSVNVPALAGRPSLLHADFSNLSDEAARGVFAQRPELFLTPSLRAPLPDETPDETAQRHVGLLVERGLMNKDGTINDVTDHLPITAQAANDWVQNGTGPIAGFVATLNSSRDVATTATAHAAVASRPVSAAAYDEEADRHDERVVQQAAAAHALAQENAAKAAARRDELDAAVVRAEQRGDTDVTAAARAAASQAAREALDADLALEAAERDALYASLSGHQARNSAELAADIEQRRRQESAVANEGAARRGRHSRPGSPTATSTP